jgi:hypothetical protein
MIKSVIRENWSLEFDQMTWLIICDTTDFVVSNFTLFFIVCVCVRARVRTCLPCRQFVKLQITANSVPSSYYLYETCVPPLRAEGAPCIKWHSR